MKKLFSIYIDARMVQIYVNWLEFILRIWNIVKIIYNDKFNEKHQIIFDIIKSNNIIRIQTVSKEENRLRIENFNVL